MVEKTTELISNNKRFRHLPKKLSLDEQCYWEELSQEIGELRHKNLSEWPVSKGEGYSYIHLDDLLLKSGICKEEAYDIFQVYGIRDVRGRWADDFKKYKFIFTLQYPGYINEWHLERWLNHDVLTPHGHEFFEKFFKIAKIWQYGDEHRS